MMRSFAVRKNPFPLLFCTENFRFFHVFLFVFLIFLHGLWFALISPYYNIFPPECKNGNGIFLCPRSFPLGNFPDVFPVLQERFGEDLTRLGFGAALFQDGPCFFHGGIVTPVQRAFEFHQLILREEFAVGFETGEYRIAEFARSEFCGKFAAQERCTGTAPADKRYVSAARTRRPWC